MLKSALLTAFCLCILGCSEEPPLVPEAVDSSRIDRIVVHLGDKAVDPNSTTSVISASTIPIFVELHLAADEQPAIRLRAKMTAFTSENEHAIVGSDSLSLNPEGRVSMYEGEMTLADVSGELEFTLDAFFEEESDSVLIFRAPIVASDAD